jgi:heme-degrading monooxygenase HmoA
MSDTGFARTPEPPYYVVIFTARRHPADDGYAAMAAHMQALAASQPGFLGVERVRDADGFGIMLSYWESEEAIKRWREHGEHMIARGLGRERWYAQYTLRVARVERAYCMGAQDLTTPDDGAGLAPGSPVS